jgi:hypothetical protein
MKINHIDGWLYVGVAVCAAITASLGTDEAIKFVPPEYLFKLKLITGAIGAGMLAGKMYRSTGFADAKQEEKGEPPKQP